tara:strand:+ start:287 stop:1057 length:771 start_codon:yes stop_codon:yes gene_type:complete
MKISYKNTEIYYTVEGEGKELVLLHGFLHSSKMWNDYVSIWKKSFQVIRIDLPGHGESGIVENISIAEMAQIVKLICDQEKIIKPTIIGHSMGGYTGLAFVEQFPESINKLILLNSSANADSIEVVKKRNIWLKIIDRHPSMFVRSVTEFLYSKENLIKLKDIVEENIQDSKSIGYDGYIEAIKAMRDRPSRIEVLKSNHDISLVAGVFDKVIEKEVSQEQMNMLAIGKGVFLEKAAHMGFLEDKEKCFEVLNGLI